MNENSSNNTPTDDATMIQLFPVHCASDCSIVVLINRPNFRNIPKIIRSRGEGVRFHLTFSNSRNPITQKCFGTDDCEKFDHERANERHRDMLEMLFREALNYNLIPFRSIESKGVRNALPDALSFDSPGECKR